MTSKQNLPASAGAEPMAPPQALAALAGLPDAAALVAAMADRDLRAALVWLVAAVEAAADDPARAELLAPLPAGPGTPAALLRGLYARDMTREAIQSVIDLGQALLDRAEAPTVARLMTALAACVPGFYWPRFVLGKLAYEAQDWPRAVAELTEAARLQPGFGWAHLLAARAALKLGRRAEARPWLDAAARAMPEMAPALAVERLRLLPASDWTDWHGEYLSAALTGETLSAEAVEDLLTLLAGMLRRAATRPALLDPLVADLTGLLRQDCHLSRDFRLAPVPALMALALALRDVDRAGPFLAQFEDRLPADLDPAGLPASFSRALAEGMQHFLCAAHLQDGGRTAAQDEFVLALARLCLDRLGDRVTAQRLAGLVAPPAPAAPAPMAAEAARIRLRAAQARGDGFEVLHALREPALAAAPSAETLAAEARALFALCEDKPDLALTAVERVLDRLAALPEPAEQADALILPIRGAIGRAYGALLAQMRAEARDGDGMAAAAEWRGWLDRFAAVIARAEALAHGATPGPRPVRPGRVVILTSPWLKQVLYYRATQLAELLTTAGQAPEVIDLTERPADTLQLALLDAACVVVQRQPATPEVMRLIFWCRRMGVPTVYDIDDQIFDPRLSPPPFEDYAGRIPPEIHAHLTIDTATFAAAMALCDRVMVSTPALADQVAAVLSAPRPIHLRRNLVGGVLAALRGEAALMARARALARAGGQGAPVEILYGSATKAHKGYFDRVVWPALTDLARRRPDLRITLLGDFAGLAVPADLADRLTVEADLLDYPAYLRRLAQADIAIAPLDLAPVTDAKSELKWFEAAALGVAAVVSPTRTYREILTDGVEALFAETREDWVTRLDRLAGDADLRAALVAASQARIARDYDLAGQAAAVAAMLCPPQPPAPRRPRLLVVNTFYWPQSVGGATRIAESYVRGLAATGDMDLYVLTADLHGRGTPPMGPTVHGADGATVIRLHLPGRDWQVPTDPAVEAQVTELARRLGLDAAHLHSVQILTGSVVAGLKAAGVPILLTLHDGWWLSEHQFLTDDAGRPFDPAPDGSELLTSTSRLTLTERWARRQVLGDLMRRCDRVVAVSGTFAQVYRAAGFPEVGVMENGVALPRRQGPRPEPAPGAPLRIGFIGGMSAHKGHDLLRRAASRQDLPNLEFVVVDHRHEAGWEATGRWGTSRVRYLGRVPQTAVAALYDRFDVLAAPSVWPESYGLVAREARALGLPVIAGHRGDIARGLRDGVDGWVIDTTDDSALAALLRRLNDAPALARLTPAPPQVVSVDQAVAALRAELAALIGRGGGPGGA